MKKFISVFLFTLIIANESQAQFTKYLVKFKYKGSNNPYTLSNPLAYLTQRSINRRTRYGIAIDSADLPVNPSYITQIKSIPNVTVLNISKWLNAVSILTTDAAAITAINALPYVQSVNNLAAKESGKSIRDKFALENNITPLPSAERQTKVEADYFNYGTSSYNEIHLHNGEFLHNIGLRGQGMQIAVLDGGFFHYTVMKSLDSARINGQFIDTFDFVAREPNVWEDDSHGMSCLSTIAANIPGQFIGKAPKANFCLYRTEDVPTEYPIEELNWACGAERADSIGSDIISTSLGYTTFDNAVFNHTYATDMNGNTTMAAIAADLAAKKGILVFAANGNDGTLPWKFLSTPADGDSVVAVGAVNTAGNVGNFSSFGPSSDGQIKPDLASVGVAAIIQTSSNTVATANGTSFACPNMAGMGTCLWQGFPEFNNVKIIRAMQQSGSKASTPDDRIGYGIPDMKQAFGKLLVDFATSTTLVTACNTTVNWTSKDINAMKYEIERKVPGETLFTKVGEVTPQAGVILANHNYSFNNAIISSTAGTVSYRIRQIIDTAAATFTALYIDTTNVTISSGCFATGTGTVNPVNEFVIIQPNPVSGNSVNLVIETSYAITNMTIAIFDAKGSLLRQLNESKGSGKKTIDLNLTRFGKGKYYIRIFNGSKSIGTAELLKL